MKTALPEQKEESKEKKSKTTSRHLSELST